MKTKRCLGWLKLCSPIFQRPQTSTTAYFIHYPKASVFYVLKDNKTVKLTDCDLPITLSRGMYPFVPGINFGCMGWGPSTSIAVPKSPIFAVLDHIIQCEAISYAMVKQLINFMKLTIPCLKEYLNS